MFSLVYKTLIFFIYECGQCKVVVQKMGFRERISPFSFKEHVFFTMSPYVFINCFLKIEMINLIKSANKIPIIYIRVQGSLLYFLTYFSMQETKCAYLLHVSVIKYPDKGPFREKGVFSPQFWIIVHFGGEVTAETCNFCMYLIHITTDGNESMQDCLNAQLSPSFSFSIELSP